MKKYVKIIIIALVFACIMTVNVSAFDTANESSLVINASELSADINDALELAKSTYSQNIARSEIPLVLMKKIYTTGNKEVELFHNPNLITPEEAVEAEDDFRTYEYLDFELLDPDNPEYTNTYNCHYYAWCMDWDGGRYWLNDVTPFIRDKHTYSFTDKNEVQVGDKITYKVNNKREHSAIVHDIINGEIICRSKWGSMGIYLHKLDQVPSIYKEYKDNGELNVEYHRYVHGEHYYGWYSLDDNQHAWKCRGCDGYTAGTAISHTYYATGTYTYAGHSVYCSGCGHTSIEDHDYYMYQDNGADGCVVKCSECVYTIYCPEAPEYDPAGASGHYISCPSGEFSFFEEHSGLITPITGNLYYHNGYCTVCNYSYTEAHTWQAVSGGYRCADCGMMTTSYPGIMSLTDEELQALFAELSEDELAAFIAGLDPEARNRVTSILTPPDDDLVTE